MAWPVLEQFSSPASQLILAPLLLARIGAEQFGLWMVALSVLFAAPLLTHGRSLALLVVVPTHDVADERIMKQLRRLLVLIGGSMVIVLLAGFGSALWLPSLQRFDHHWLLVFLGLVAALLAVVEIDHTFACVLKGHTRFDLAALSEAVGRGLHVGACVVLVQAGSSVLLLLWVTLAVFVLKAAMKWWAVRRVLGSHRGSAEHGISAEDMAKELRRLGRWNCLQVISGMAFYAFDRWIVAFSLGAVQVSAYAIVALYAQFVHSISASAAQVLVPWVARRLNANATDADRRHVVRTAFIAAPLCCMPIALAWSLSMPALSLWISPDFARSVEPLVDRLSLAFLLLSLNIPFISLLFGLRQARFVSLLLLFNGALLVLVALAWPPADTLAIANLKIGYALISLLSAVQFVRLMRSHPPKIA